MNLRRLENKLKKMSELLKRQDIIKDFPSILEDLEFIIKKYKLEIDNLTEDQMINHIYDLEYYKIDYLSELMRKYMELTWNKKFNYEIADGKLLTSSAGYNQDSNIVTISVIGLIMNSDNLIDTIRTIIHEYRHQQQFYFMHEKDIKGILNYPSYFINIARNYLPKEINVIKDKEGNIIDKPYYYDNYKRIYTEQDANSYAILTLETFLIHLYEQYPNKNEKLTEKVTKLQNEITKETKTVAKNLQQEGKINTSLLTEIYLRGHITSKVIIDKKEKDSLLYIDKTIKKEPILKDKYEVLNILMNDYSFKKYEELMLDRVKAIEKYGNNSKISMIFDNIINSDPVLLITKFIKERNIEEIKDFLKKHPTFKDEYKEEIEMIINSNTIDGEIVNLLNKKEKVKIKNK